MHMFTKDTNETVHRSFSQQNQKRGTKTNVQKQENGYINCDLFIQQNVTLQYKRIKNIYTTTRMNFTPSAKEVRQVHLEQFHLCNVQQQEKLISGNRNRGNDYLWWEDGMNTDWKETQRTSGRLGIIYILSWVVITQMYSYVKANQGIECTSAKHFIKSFTKKQK